MTFAVRAALVAAWSYGLAGMLLLPLLIWVSALGGRVPGRTVAVTWGWLAAALVGAAFVGRLVAMVAT